MNHATPPTLARIRTAISRIAICCALGFSAATHAQTTMDPAIPGITPTMTPAMTPTITSDPYAQGMYAGVGLQKPSTRSVFVGTIAALLAQGLGSALSQGLGGSITQWFSATPRAKPPSAAPAMTAHAGGQRERPLGLQAGVAYEVHLIDRDGVARAVDPANHAFRTGDRFQVHYRPTLPGRINVSNVDPRGSESRIDSVEVAAGQLATLGPYQFVQAKGQETLKLLLQPCSSPLLTAASRAIVKTAAAAAAAGPAVRIGDCADAKTRTLQAKTRTIRKTTLEGSTAFALDPLSSDEIKSGRLASREVLISLLHR